jgi:hypothetical protein
MINWKWEEGKHEVIPEEPGTLNMIVTFFKI